MHKKQLGSWLAKRTPTTPTTPMSEKPYHETDHFHCWQQGKSPACGNTLDWHEVCCLCTIPYKRRHTDSTKKESFSDFFHNASPEEKERVMLEVAREATNDQREQIGLPPLHTSPEKDYERNYSHYHCWDQDQPPACGIPMKKHEQCCLCDLKPVSQGKESSEHQHYFNKHVHLDIWACDCGWRQTFPDKVPASFTEKTLNLFREKFVRDDGLMDKYYTYGGGEPGDHTAFMADAIEEFFEDKLKESAENERSRTLALIESKRREIGEETYCKTCKQHRAAGECDCLGWNAALTSLAEELKQESAP